MVKNNLIGEINHSNNLSAFQRCIICFAPENLFIHQLARYLIMSLQAKKIDLKKVFSLNGNNKKVVLAVMN